MTIDEFGNLTDIEMCQKMNEYMETHTKRNFKSQTMNFSFLQAEKVMENRGIYKFGGVYRTGLETIELINNKEKERKKRILTVDDIEKLSEILQPEKYERLMKLLNSYNYVSDFILNEDRSIKIKSGQAEEIHTTTVRMYDSTKKQWKEFTKKHSGYTTTDLLNTALLEYMKRHAID